MPYGDCKQLDSGRLPKTYSLHHTVRQTSDTLRTVSLRLTLSLRRTLIQMASCRRMVEQGQT